MTDNLESNARCMACDTPVHTVCKGGEARFVECTPSPDGEWELMLGHLQERPIGSMVTRLQRFRDHKLHCGKSLRPDPATVPTRPLRPEKIRRQ